MEMLFIYFQKCISKFGYKITVTFLKYQRLNDAWHTLSPTNLNSSLEYSTKVHFIGQISVMTTPTRKNKLNAFVTYFTESSK